MVVAGSWGEKGVGGVGGHRRDLVQTSGGTMALILSELEPLMVCDQGCVSLKVIDVYILFLFSYAGGADYKIT